MTGAFNTTGSFLRRHGWMVAFAVIPALAVAAIAVRGWLGPRVAIETVAQHDFVQTIVASGRVQAPNRVDLGAQITGTEARIPVAGGQIVTAGSLLIELESAELRAVASQVDGAVVQARARLRQLRDL